MTRARKLLPVCLFLTFSFLSFSATALEYPVGAPQQRYGMEIAAVYLQPVTMEPEGMMRPAEQSDIHLEADIHALAGNPQGFDEGFWMPYLVVKYELSKQGGDDKLAGDLMPMTASDGPHYGDNVKLLGPGRYHLKLSIQPPSMNAHAHFGRHTDRLTGVRPWWKPFELEYDFVFVGLGKKGGY
jgi:periplasmic iron binding protein